MKKLLCVLLLVACSSEPHVDAGPDGEAPDARGVLDAAVPDSLFDANAPLCTPDPNQCYDLSVPEAELMIDEICKPAINLCEWDYFRYWLGEGQCVTLCCPDYAGTIFELRCVCGTDDPPPMYPPGNCDHLVPDGGVPLDAPPKASPYKTENWPQETP